ncbi:MAG: MATE family efflux transporter, partial [Candidatus Methanomethylophilaceae archaeon]|nr:MATE family efflux transporter [Candidatus Methanomethylophilaceae archaeon]
MGRSDDNSFFGTDSIGSILKTIAPPVMVAQLIQALYNIVDSLFIGHYSPDGLTALSVIFPVQLVLTALAVGTGVGVNTLMARQYAMGKDREANYTAG